MVEEVPSTGDIDDETAEAEDGHYRKAEDEEVSHHQVCAPLGSR